MDLSKRTSASWGGPTPGLKDLLGDGPAIALIGVAVLIRIRHFLFYQVPGSDYFAFAATARQIWNGTDPSIYHSTYQRPPFYPIVFGGLAKLIPAKDPLLVAGAGINLVLFVVSMVLLYLLARRLIGSWALLVILLFALDPNVVEVSLQPLAEQLSITLVLLACYWSGRRGGLAYLAGGLASITRYEGVLVLPGLLLRDLVRRRFAGIGWAALAVVPLLLWVGASYKATGFLNPYHSYFGDAASAAGLEFISSTTRVFYGIVTPTLWTVFPESLLTTVLWVLVTAGFVVLLRRRFSDVLPILTYFLLTLGINLVFFSPARQHVLMLSWVLDLAVVASIAWVAERVTRFTQITPEGPRTTLGWTMIGLVIAATVGFATWSLRRDGLGDVITVFATSAVLIWAALQHADATRRTRILVMVLLVAASGLFARQNVQAVDEMLGRPRYNKAGLRLVGEWFRESGELRHRMAVTEPWIPAYYAGPDFESRLVAMADIPGDSPQELAQGCRKLGISYVVFDSDNGFMRPGEFYYTWYHVGLLRDLRFGRSTPDFTLVATLRNGFSYAHIYRLNGVETP